VIPRSQLVLRAIVFLGPVLALLMTGPAGDWPAWWLVLPVAGMAAASAAAPDSPVGAGAGLIVLVWWSVSLGDGVPRSVLVAAAALLAGHVAALLAAYGPREMPIDRATILLWVRRGALVLPTVPGAWLLVRALRGQPEQPGIWMLAVATACVATIVATAAVDVRRTDQ
jgi:ABC-type spermidine/putrescine transport system permease subunit II